MESPPYFTALTENACDLTSNQFRARDKRLRLTVHRLEAVSATPPPDPVAVQQGKGETTRDMRSRIQGRPPVAAVDVCVLDGFLRMTQTVNQCTTVMMRHALHLIDDVFRPLQSPHDQTHLKEPASVKKMLKGDACWLTQKRILGWDLDS